MSAHPRPSEVLHVGGFVIHAIFLIVATTLSYLWIISPVLSPFTLQLVGVLTLAYFIASWAGRKKKATHRTVITLDLTILTITILLLIAETGGLSSPLFFTLYFLMFAVALLFETEATLVLTGVLVAFLALLPNTDITNLTHLSELTALIMITPLALIAGHQHEEIIEERKQKQRLTRHLSREESDTLLFLSLNLKHTLTKAIDNLTLTIPQTPNNTLRDNLKTLYQDLKLLYRSAGELQKTIDQETDILK